MKFWHYIWRNHARISHGLQMTNGLLVATTVIGPKLAGGLALGLGLLGVWLDVLSDESDTDKRDP